MPGTKRARNENRAIGTSLGANLKTEAKGHSVKLALAKRLRKETTLTIREIAERLHMGS
jgi:hypothetical protein